MKAKDMTEAIEAARRIKRHCLDRPPPKGTPARDMAKVIDVFLELSSEMKPLDEESSLSASAPDLLAACEFVKRWCEVNQREGSKIYSVVCEAIARAESTK